jgi:hypothetical protein
MARFEEFRLYHRKNGRVHKKRLRKIIDCCPNVDYVGQA